MAPRCAIYCFQARREARVQGIRPRCASGSEETVPTFPNVLGRSNLFPTERVIYATRGRN